MPRFTMLCAAIKLSAFSQAICGSILLAQEPAWIARYRGAGGWDGVSSLATDPARNVYFTGTDSRGFITVKYNAAGVEQWIARFVEPDGWAGYPSAIAVDSFGHVYVAGYSYRMTPDFDYQQDFAIVKYNAAGAQQWVAYYDGPASRDDRPFALVVDQAGAVYVTGSSWGIQSWTDYATVKYDSAGVEQWVARYNGPAGGEDWPRAILLDSTGSVYVAGTSDINVPGYRYRYAMVKYDTSGIEQWASHYHGPGNGGNFCSALAVDTAGNAYVTGTSYSTETNDDIVTVKFDSSGVEQWAAWYDAPEHNHDNAVSVVVDAAGNVYVGGDSQTSDSTGAMTLIKYDAAGAQQWVTRYQGPQNDISSWAYGLIMDSDGNLYMTGGSRQLDLEGKFTTLRFDPSGQPQWIRRDGGPDRGDDYAQALALSPAGGVVVAGGSWGDLTGWDVATLSYDASGQQRWSARYVGPPFGSDSAYGLTADAAGNVYVTGGSESALHEIESATVKYDTSGAEQWVARFDASTNGGTEGHDVAVDEAGNVYVAATAWDSGHASDFAVIKYDSSGVEQWAARYDGPERAEDDVADIAVDPAGNVYVTGRSRSYTTHFDYLTIKYDSSGVRQWSARYDGSAHGDDEAVALAVDAAGNVFVTGQSTAAGDGTSILTIKYDGEGIEQWAMRVGEPARAAALALDAAGGVYVTGSRGWWPPAGYVTAKYDSCGQEQWVAGYDGLNGGGGQAAAIALDCSGNVYVAGIGYGGGTNADYATVKYNPNGVQQWSARYNSPNNYIDEAVGLAVDSLGVAYVTGRTRPDNSSWAYATVKYDPAGVERWASYYTGPGWGDEWVAAVVVDGSGNAYVTGASAENDEYMSDYATLKFSRPSGDPDDDGDIDLNDFARFAECLSGPAPPPGSVDVTCLESLDFDSDTNLDLRDFSALARFLADP